MGFFDSLKKKKKKEEESIDPLNELDLPHLKKGYMVDYDLKTYQVTGYNTYDYGDGYVSKEWELTSGDERLYLEMEEDDGIYWSLAKKIPVGSFDKDVKAEIIENDEAPEEIVYKGKTYFLDEESAGHMQKGGAGSRQEFISWTYVDEKKNFINIEQWGETEFEASAGWEAEEYQFTNILPASS